LSSLQANKHVPSTVAAEGCVTVDAAHGDVRADHLWARVARTTGRLAAQSSLVADHWHICPGTKIGFDLQISNKYGSLTALKQ
jgi:hypothetical protein